MLVLGYGLKNIWIIARQHPGESMAEWWMEGLLERLIFSDDNISAKILEIIAKPTKAPAIPAFQPAN